MPYRFTGDTETEGGKRCGGCRKVKPVDCFRRASDRPSGRQSYCKTCQRVARERYELSAKGRATQKRRRLDRPEDPARVNARAKKYQRTPKGKIVQCKSKAVCKLRVATEPARRTRLAALIGAYDRELERLRAR